MKKKIISTLLVVGLMLGCMSLTGYVGATEEPLGILAISRTHGFAVARVGENESVRMPVHMVLRGVLFRPVKTENITIGRFAIKDGILAINETKYNITKGMGVLILERHDLMLTVNGTSPSGENFRMRLWGKWFNTPNGTILIRNMTGPLIFESESKLLFLGGAVLPKPPLLQIP